MKKTLLLSAAALFTLVSFGQTWSVDKAHSQLNFSVTHLGIAEVGGGFRSFDSKITSSKDDFSDATVELTAEVSSINTGNDQRDNHLKSPDFFDAAKFSTLTFKSKSFTKAGGKKYKVTGDLTLHGVTKTVTLDATLNGTTVHPMNKKTIAGFTFTGIIKRSDFGVAPSMPAAMLADDVKLMASGEFAKD
ncbi:MAG: polyisoprenoid-binding protein [Bacteroidetes bacterium]|nr:polyisoprenoid-binding protein [Bacteroidota bacterium]